MIILGIDPGQSGGFCIVSGASIACRPFPFAGKELDVQALVGMWGNLAREPSRAVIEQQHARPISSKVAMFSLGRNYGTILGLLGALGIGTEIVTPRGWKDDILQGVSDKDKDAAIAYVRRVFPYVDLTSGGRHKPHDGMADAVCIAEYGRRHFTTTPTPASPAG